MKNKYIQLLTILFLSLSVKAQTLPFAKASSYKTGVFDNGGSEIVAFDRASQMLFSTNGNSNKLDIIDISDVEKIFKVKSVDLSPYIQKVNSVSAYLGIIAVAGEGIVPQSNGKVLFFNQNGNFISQITVGPMPDMLTFTPSGNFLLVANEGEPSDDYTTDPPGSVTIVNVGGGVNNLQPSDIMTVDFSILNGTTIDPLINIYGNNGQQTIAQDLEPEYIAVNPASNKAYVSLQENNALMIIDILFGNIDTIIGLGYVDRGLAGNGLDASSTASSINISTYPRLFGMYQPDAMVSFEVNGNTYIASANEGDSRDYPGYSEEATVGTVPLHPAKFPNAATLQLSDNLGNLKITRSLGDNDGDGLYDSLFTFGGRSFSIWDDNGSLVWDSGDEFEQIIAQAYPTDFNSDNDDNSSFKSRSDDKGPEPEAITVGEVDGTLYAFIGLERMGGLMIYDISDPTNPQFVQYELNRDFSVPANDPQAGDLGPESVIFIPASQSPSGLALVVVGSEVSGTVSVYQVGIGIGIKEYPVNSLSAYPNPSLGSVHLSAYGNYKVYNTDGKIVGSVIDNNFIDLRDQPPGLYIIKDTDENILRIIKN